MIWLAIRGIRFRLAAHLAVFVGTLLGAALLVVAGSFFETGIRLTAHADRLAAAPLIVVGAPDYALLAPDGSATTDWRPYPERHRIAADQVNVIGGVDGVSAATAVYLIDGVITADGRSAPTTLQNASSAVFGREMASLDDSIGRGEVVLTLPLAQRLGLESAESVQLTVGGERIQATVARVLGDPGDPDTVIISDDDVARLVDVATADAIAVTLVDGADISQVNDAISTVTPNATILEGDGRGAAEYPEVSASRTPTIVTGAVFGGIVIVVLATVVSATIGLSVRQRAREISLLRATGATGRQARRLIVLEVLAVGLVGAAAGVAAGIPLSAGVYWLAGTFGLIPPALERELGVVPLAAAFVVTAVVLALSARSASRPARRARALDALREADTPSNRVGFARWFFGIIFGLGAIALAVLTAIMPPSVVSATSGPAVLAGSISAALLAPVWLRLGGWMLRPGLRLTVRGLAPLASADIRARRVQLATVTACVALVIGVGVGNLAAQAIQVDAARVASLAPFRADVVVRVPGGVDDAVTDRLAGVEGIEAVSEVVTSGGWIERPFDGSHPDRPWPLLGITSADAFAYAVSEGSLESLTGSTIALPARHADNLGLAVGDQLDLRLGDGALETLTLVATYADREGYERALLPAELLAAHTTARTAPLLIATGADGIEEAVRAEFHGDPLVEVGGRRMLGDSLDQGLTVQSLINALLVATAAGYAAIAVVNTLAVTILSRRREFALLRLSGATRRQLRLLLAVEVAVVAVCGAVAGLVVAAAAVFPTALAVGGSAVNAGAVAVVGSLLLVVALIVAPVTVAVMTRATVKSAVTELGSGL